MTRRFSVRGPLALALAFGLAASLAAGKVAAQGSTATPDPDFEALQRRGQVGMCVDQYASTHLFDALPDGGRIELQYDSDDPEAVATIRRHLQEIQLAFATGDFGTPMLVHAGELPGTAVMAALRDRIEYRYADLPRGGELRLITSDAQALAAIGEFMAFQRAEHRAGGMDHAGMDHAGGMDHAAMHPGGTDPAAMDHAAMHGADDPAFAADMAIVHELVTNHRAITRTVSHLPNGVRTLTESSSPQIAALIVEHVRSMEARLASGDVFNLFSHTLPVIFEGYERVRSEFEYSGRGVAVVQTSDDPALVQALQAHAAEVTELVDEGMIAMMRGMMERQMQERGGPGAGHRPPPTP